MRRGRIGGNHGSYSRHPEMLAQHKRVYARLDALWREPRRATARERGPCIHRSRVYPRSEYWRDGPRELIASRSTIVAEIVGALGVPHTPFFPALVEREGPQCETARFFAAVTRGRQTMRPAPDLM